MNGDKVVRSFLGGKGGLQSATYLREVLIETGNCTMGEAVVRCVPTYSDSQSDCGTNSRFLWGSIALCGDDSEIQRLKSLKLCR